MPAPNLPPGALRTDLQAKSAGCRQAGNLCGIVQRETVRELSCPELRPRPAAVAPAYSPAPPSASILLGLFLAAGTGRKPVGLIRCCRNVPGGIRIRREKLEQMPPIRGRQGKILALISGGCSKIQRFLIVRI